MKYICLTSFLIKTPDAIKLQYRAVGLWHEFWEVSLLLTFGADCEVAIDYLHSWAGEVLIFRLLLLQWHVIFLGFMNSSDFSSDNDLWFGSSSDFSVSGVSLNLGGSDLNIKFLLLLLFSWSCWKCILYILIQPKGWDEYKKLKGSKLFTDEGKSVAGHWSRWNGKDEMLRLLGLLLFFLAY